MAKMKIGVSKKVHTTYLVSSKKKKKKLSGPVQTETNEKRHYCKYCKRKRIESSMTEAGQGAYGKKSWRCKEQAACLRIAELKKKH